MRGKITDGMGAYLTDADGGRMAMVVANAVVGATRWKVKD